MSRPYTVVDGDTVGIIARKVYGDDLKSDLITKGNPGIAQSLQVGTTLIIPNDPDQPIDTPISQVSGPTEVAVIVAGVRFRYWTDVSMTLAMDAVDTIEFSAPYNVELTGVVKAFAPFSFADVSIQVGGSEVFRGTIVDPVSSIRPGEKTISINAYSTPGVLSDCTPSASSYPLEWDNATLDTVAGALCKPFGISVEFPDGAGPPFERVSLSPGQRILSFLSNLASQRKLVIKSSPQGALVLYRPSAKTGVVAVLKQGSSPLVSVTPQLQPQSYYSHVTGITPVFVGFQGAQFTVKNTLLDGTLRPFTYEAPDTPDSELQAAVESKAGRMFASAINYKCQVDTWRTEAGKLWAPEDAITLLAPEAGIRKEYTFQIRSVEFSKTAANEQAILTLITPGALAGELPGGLPWADA